MSTGLTKVTKEFNKSNKPWALTGNFAVAMHSYHSGGQQPKPVSEYQIVIKNSNFQTFFNKLTNMRYKWDHMTSNRNRHRFTKNGQSNIILLLRNNSPRIIRYNKHPIERMSNERLGGIATRRKFIKKTVNNLLSNVSLN